MFELENERPTERERDLRKYERVFPYITRRRAAISDDAREDNNSVCIVHSKQLKCRHNRHSCWNEKRWIQWPENVPEKKSKKSRAEKKCVERCNNSHHLYYNIGPTTSVFVATSFGRCKNAMWWGNAPKVLVMKRLLDVLLRPCSLLLFTLQFCMKSIRRENWNCYSLRIIMSLTFPWYQSILKFQVKIKYFGYFVR